MVSDARSHLVEQFFASTLPKSEWTHEAHLTVCHHVLAQIGVSKALETLRVSIRRYNEAVGTANTDSSGYHETITRYYLGAVEFSGPDLSTVLKADLTSRNAPLRFWSKPALFSSEARNAWMPPDLAPLPWPVDQR
ncbi:MAG: hypothetical protein AAFN74_11740 [Myxococcota bacterium]